MAAEVSRAPLVRERKIAPKAPRINLGLTSMARAARLVSLKAEG